MTPDRPHVEIVVSDRPEDVDEFFAIVHEGFVEAGYAPPQPSGRRLIPHYLDPATRFLLAQVDGEPAGGCALHLDGPFGLPADRAFVEEIDGMRCEGHPILECGSLVVRPAWRRHTRQIFLHLMGAAMRALGEHGPDARILISVTPESERFYSGLFDFAPVAPPRPLYGAPAVLMRSDYTRIMDLHLHVGAASHRLLAGLALGPPGSWLVDRRTGEPWPSDWLWPLLRESGVVRRLTHQLEALDQRMESSATLSALAVAA